MASPVDTCTRFIAPIALPFRRLHLRTREMAHNLSRNHLVYWITKSALALLILVVLLYSLNGFIVHIHTNQIWPGIKQSVVSNVQYIQHLIKPGDIQNTPAHTKRSSANNLLTLSKTTIKKTTADKTTGNITTEASTTEKTQTQAKGITTLETKSDNTKVVKNQATGNELSESKSTDNKVSYGQPASRKPVDIETQHKAYAKGLFPLKPDESHHDPYTIHITSAWIILIIGGFAYGSWHNKRSRRTLVDRFVNHTNGNSSDSKPVYLEGVSQLLVNELVRINSNKPAGNDVGQRAVPTQVVDEALDPSFKATYGLDSPNQQLTSSETNIPLGGLQIPIGTLYSLASRLSGGTRISGGLYKDGEKYSLAAQCTRNGMDMTWQTGLYELETSPPNNAPSLPQEMIKELACQIFISLNFGPAAKWKAVNAYMEGVETYFDCINKPDDRQLKLKNAEKRLIEALAEDEQFTAAYYNLGVVYTELKQYDAARLAFEKAIKARPDHYEAYYGLAVNYFNSRQYNKTADICEHILTIQPGSVKAHYLKGRAELAVHDPVWIKRMKDNRGDLSKCADNAVSCLKTSVAISWKSLLSDISRVRSLRGKDDDIIEAKKKSVSNCLRNLAIVYCYQATELERRENTGARQKKRPLNPKSRQLLKHAAVLCKQALLVDSKDANIHYEMGRIYIYLNKPYDASQSLEKAIKIADFDPRYWAYLTYAYALRCRLLMAQKQQYVLAGENVPKSLNDECAHMKMLVSRSRKATLRYLACQPCNGNSNGYTNASECARAIQDLLLHTLVRNSELDPFNRVLGYVLSKKRVNKAARLCKRMIAARSVINSLGRLGDRSETRLLSEENSRHLLEIQGNNAVWRLNDTSPSWADAVLTRWEHAELALTLGLHYQQTDPGQAEYFFNRALSSFEESFGEDFGKAGLAVQNCNKSAWRYFFESEIRCHHLHAYIALSQASQENRHEELRKSLATARMALEEDPLGGTEHEVIGMAHFRLSQFDQALESFQCAHRWNPNSPEVHMRMGMTYWQMAEDCRVTDERKGILNSAVDYLTEALHLYTPDNFRKIAQTHYWLGRACLDQSKYKEAMSHFRIACNLHTKKQDRLLPSFYLGVAYLRNQDLDECREEFQQAVLDARKLVNRNVPIYRDVGQTYQDDCFLGEILVQLLVFGVYSSTLRDKVSGNHYAFLGKARRTLLPLLRRYYWTQTLGNSHRDTKVRLRMAKLLANILDCRGWLYFKEDKPDDAIVLYKTALSHSIDPEIYYHIALAQETTYKREKRNDPSNKTRLSEIIEEIEVCCQNARKHDIRERYSSSIRQMEQHVQQYRKDLI